MCAPRGRRGHSSYTFTLRIIHAKRGEGFQIACKNAYVTKGKPHSHKTQLVDAIHVKATGGLVAEY